MREILFRGKRKDNGEWTQGYLFRIWEEAYICWGTVNDVPDMKEVDPETVCECTGFEDKNGRKIFEGDIVLFTDNIKIKGTTSHISKVEWNTEIGGFVFHAECIGYYNVNPSQIEKYEVEVIDNIFDNPELLKGDAK